MIVKRTYSFSERVRVLTLTAPEKGLKHRLDKICSATRLQQVEYEVEGESLRLAAQAHLLEIELPAEVNRADSLAAQVGDSLRAELQRLDTGEPEVSHGCPGVLATQGLLMVVLPPDLAQPAGEKKATLGFRAR